MTMRAKRYQNSAALLIFMRRTTIPHSSFLIQAELSNVIMGRHAREANLEPIRFLFRNTCDKSHQRNTHLSCHLNTNYKKQEAR